MRPASEAICRAKAIASSISTGVITIFHAQGSGNCIPLIHRFRGRSIAYTGGAGPAPRAGALRISAGRRLMREAEPSIKRTGSAAALKPNNTGTARGWMRWVPGLQMLRTYRPEWLLKDVIAGLVLTTMLVPVGIAYAVAS